MLSAATKPRKPPNRTRNAAMTLKTSKEIRDRLEALREKSCRSLTQEVEHQILKAFDFEEQIALQEQIKAEMRGTIAALEARIALMEERDRTLYPDESARALGRAFALALTAARHASGRDWREDYAAPAIVAGAVRRLMDRSSRGGESGSMVASLFDKTRIAATADSIAKTLATSLAEAMPPLPPLHPQDDPANWTPRAHSAVTFRDKTTGKLLEVVHGPEFDLADPEANRGLGPDHRAAFDRLYPIRDTVDVDDFIVHALVDGSTSWERLSGTGPKIHVPAGQDAPPAPEPAARLATPEEVAGTTPARGVLSPTLADRALMDDAKSGLPLVQAEREEQDAQRRADRPPAGANVRGRKAKAKAPA